MPAVYAICNRENIWAYKQIFDNLGFSPNAILADGLPGLQTAIDESFGNGARRLMCFYHAKVSMDRKAQNLRMTKPHKKIVMEDVTTMQRAESEVEFFKLAQLFLTKWREFDVQKVFLKF